MRTDLDLTLERFAALGGSSKGSQILYEKGNAPTADYLAGLAKHGIDVLYILTGRHTPGVIHEIRRRFGALIEMAEVGDHLERLMQAEAEAGNAQDRDIDLLSRAFLAANKGFAEVPPMPPERRAALILAAYDLLAENDEASKKRVIELVTKS